ncbi:MAG: hypothetical protein ROZ64_04730 [Burkholderiaceae bacterium]|jgi:hypothetical protein|nr:hypothetical protein [Burkholderiaceae bacterium]
MKHDKTQHSGAPAKSHPRVQGEGDYEAARHYRKDVEAFVESGKVGEAMKDAAPRNDDEARQMEHAEKAGKARSKGEDPALHKGARTKH